MHKGPPPSLQQGAQPGDGQSVSARMGVGMGELGGQLWGAWVAYLAYLVEHAQLEALVEDATLAYHSERLVLEFGTLLEIR